MIVDVSSIDRNDVSIVNALTAGAIALYAVLWKEMKHFGSMWFLFRNSGELIRDSNTLFSAIPVRLSCMVL
jgi:hypothetical protein